MVNPTYKRIIRKKRKHRAGKKTHANCLKRQEYEVKFHAESIENISLTPGTFTSTSQSEIPTGSSQKTFDSETKTNTKNIDNSETKPPISDDFNGLKPYSPELIAFEELYQNISYQKETLSQIKPLQKDLISQLISQVSDEEHLHIDEYAQYLDL